MKIAWVDSKVIVRSVKRQMVLWMALVLCLPSHASPALEPIPDLKALSGSDRAEQKKIGSIALAWWLKHRGLLAEEGSTVAGYFTVARPIKGFADRGDKVWDVRIDYLGFQPTGVLWITKKVKK